MAKSFIEIVETLRGGGSITADEAVVYAQSQIRGARQHVADTLAAACVAASKAGDIERAKRFADAQACVAEMFSDVKL